MIDNIHYIAADATEPYQKSEGQAYNYLLHVCNNVGAWGAGFVIPLAKKWPHTKQAYTEAVLAMSLGENQIVPVEDNLAVVNMIAQLDVIPIAHKYSAEHVRRVSNETSTWRNHRSAILPNIQYDALFRCLETIGQQAHPDSRFHFPMFGAGLGGGNWDLIAAIINSTLTYRYETWCYVFEEKYMHLCKRDPLTNPMPGDTLAFAGLQVNVKEREGDEISWETITEKERVTSINKVSAFVKWVTSYKATIIKTASEED